MRRSPTRAAAPLLLAMAGIVLPPGARLHLEPDVASTSIAVVDAEVEVEPEEVRDGWILVRYFGHRGWVRSGPPEPLQRQRAERTPGIGTTPQDVFLDSRCFPGGVRRELVVERWRLLTDVEDEALLERISRTGGLAPDRFNDWWGMSTNLASGNVILLFARSEEAHTVDPLACGRIRNGVVTASVVPGDPDATVRRVLHQLGHLFAVDLMGNTIPPWLEEGLADSFAAIGEKGAGLQEPIFRNRRGPSAESPVPPPLASVLGAGRELFADDIRGEALRREAMRLARFFWNGGVPARFDRFCSFVGEGRAGKALNIDVLERKSRMRLPDLVRKVRSLREPPPTVFRGGTIARADHVKRSVRWNP